MLGRYRLAGVGIARLGVSLPDRRGEKTPKHPTTGYVFFTWVLFLG